MTPIAKLSQRFPARRAFITGAASGLGRALALEFARAGWRLGVLDISQQRLASAQSELRNNGAQVVTVYCSGVGLEPFVSSSVSDFAAEQGGLDILINNAGVAVAGGIDLTAPEDSRWIVDIDLLGPVWGCRAAIPIMRRQHGGLF